MSRIYSAEKHDWDYTLFAAKELLEIGILMDKKPRKGNMSMGFSALTGSMLLSFSGIESFSASVALCISEEKKFPDFEYDNYRSKRRFWDKLDLLFSATGQEMDKSAGLFKTISEMQRWRNLVTHAKPYKIEPTEIHETVKSPLKQHKKEKAKEYIPLVKVDNARRFFEAAYGYVEYLKKGAGVHPRTKATFGVGNNQN